MPRLQAIEVAVPPYKVRQDAAKGFAEAVFSSRFADIERLLPIFDNAGIDTRYFSMPVEWFGEDHPFEEKNHAYIESATTLGTQASQAVLKTAGLEAEAIDYIIYVNSTGLATPSIDARLINTLSLRRNIRRSPLWGLGCAGGAAGLAHAYHYLIGHPTHRVLLVAVELCGLTFLRDDYSKSNLTACALFGEGAAAAVLCGDAVEADGLDIIATQSTFYPDSLKVMGWNIVSHGMQVVFDKRIPDIVAANAAQELDCLLSGQHLSQKDIVHYLYHPGGMKVVQAYEEAYRVNGESFALPRAILHDYGNMSSVTVLFVIARYLEKYGVGNPGYGVVSALGPGFCSESLLVKL